MTSSLVYSPGVAIVIDSAIAGAVDVSDDVSQGSLTLRENGSHNISFTLENPNRKYDGLFVPNDRVIVQMKRFKWIQIFSGYIDSVPYFSAYARQVNVSAQCTLKVLKNWPWDRSSQAAYDLISGARTEQDKAAQDGGMSAVVINLLTTVTQWPKDRIHIGKVPAEWIAKYQTVYSRVEADAAKEVEALGLNAIIHGDSVSMAQGAGTGPTIGAQPNAAWNLPPGSDADIEKMTISASDYDVVLATIRKTESGNNYKQLNATASASGAYQFVDRTWGGYGGYARAYLAPPAVQDARALSDVQGVVAQFGNKLLNIPRYWYIPASLTDPQKWPLDRKPDGNPLTIREYGIVWGKNYIAMYTQMRGTSPTTGSTTATVIGYTAANDALPSTTTTSGSSTGVLYPIIPGKVGVSYADAGWGEYENGKIPSSALKFTPRTAQGHPLAVESWNKLCDEAEKLGYNFKGAMYRSFAGQVALSTGMGVKIPGTSVHGWGLAIDIDLFVSGASSKYKGQSLSSMYDTPEYKWLFANAYKWGWVHPPWAQQGQSKAEPWHWEFAAIYSYLNGATPGAGGGGQPTTDSTSSTLGDNAPLNASQLFAAIAGWQMDPADISLESDTLLGYRALMNDEPIMVIIEQLIKASGRSYCTAPNGDFIAWWPDYWGEYGIAGAMDIEIIELKDFTVDWSDESLITHQYVEGAWLQNVTSPLPVGILDSMHALDTRGVVTIDMPGVLSSLVNMKDGGAQYPWLNNPAKLLQRFGARVNYSQNAAVMGSQQEFFSALQLFSRAWASQFTGNPQLTFMPELFPGMLMRIPHFKVQMYITSVTHSWDYAEGAGFTTSAQTIAISSTEGSGFYLFPAGGNDIQMPGTGDDSESGFTPTNYNVNPNIS